MTPFDLRLLDLTDWLRQFAAEHNNHSDLRELVGEATAHYRTVANRARQSAADLQAESATSRTRDSSLTSAISTARREADTAFSRLQAVTGMGEALAAIERAAGLSKSTASRFLTTLDADTATPR